MVISKPDLKAIADLAQKHDFYVLSDEIYSRLVYDGSAAESIYTIDGMPERTIIVDGFSKSYAMTGWRLGYAIMPDALAAKVSLLLTHAVGCTAGFTQRAGIVALQECDDDVGKVVQQYQKRRDAFVTGLNGIDGVSCRLPEEPSIPFPMCRHSAFLRLHWPTGCSTKLEWPAFRERTLDLTAKGIYVSPTPHPKLSSMKPFGVLANL